MSNITGNTSGFNYPSAAGKTTNTNEIHSDNLLSSVSMRTVDDHHEGKLGGEHGGAGTRQDDRQGIILHNDGHSATPAIKETRE